MSNPEKYNPKLETNVYEEVSASEIFENRAQRGENADVRETDEGMVEKSDKVGKTPLIAREFIITDYLRNTGVVPKVDVDSGLYGYPLTFQMEKLIMGHLCKIGYTITPKEIEVFMSPKIPLLKF